MPDLREAHPLVKEWITLPQALRWIVDGIKPDLAGEPGSLPSFPEGDRSRRDLYRYWINGQLELRGQSGIDSTCVYDETTSRVKIDCHETGDLKCININLIRRAGIDRIDWKHGTLSQIKYNDDDGEYYVNFYFENLRVHWESLCKLATEDNFSKANQTAVKNLFVGGKRGRGGPKRSDWPLITALAAIIWEHEPEKRNSYQGICNRTGKILQAGKYEVDGKKYKPAPSREGFLREVIPALEQVIELYPGKNDTPFKKRIGHGDTLPDILSCASALSAIIISRGCHDPRHIPEFENIVQVLASHQSANSDIYGNFSEHKLTDTATKIARMAQEYYKKDCDRLSNSKGKFP